jgi:prophage DNA circulation protein
MYRADAQEAVPLATLILNELLAQTPLSGETGSDVRSAIGNFIANAIYLIQNDISGPALADIFNKAQIAGISPQQLDVVRGVAVAQSPLTLGATLIQNALIEFTLATECAIYSTYTFVSREDVDAAQQKMNAAFAPIEEILADDMDYATYRAMIELHAALSYHFAMTALSLPRMMTFQFWQPAPTLYFAYRLYADASRADQLLAENGVVHPAFMRPQGRALSP